MSEYLAVYRHAGEIEILIADLPDRPLVWDIGRYDADGAEWDEAVDRMLTAAGWRRTTEWTSAGDDATAGVERTS